MFLLVVYLILLFSVICTGSQTFLGFGYSVHVMDVVFFLVTFYFMAFMTNNVTCVIWYSVLLFEMPFILSVCL